MTPHPWLRPLALAAAGGVGIGIAMLDRAQDEIQPAVLMLFVAAFAFACWRPRDAWAYALLLGAGVPGLDLVSRLQGAPQIPNSAPGSTMLAFLPAALGAASGAIARGAFRRRTA